MPSSILFDDPSRLWIRPVTFWKWLFNRKSTIESGPHLNVPVRACPRTFESAERIYLTWLHHITWISVLGAILYTTLEPSISMFSWLLGMFVTVLSIMYAIYAYMLWKYRIIHLLKFDNVHYEDVTGATIVTALLVTVLLATFCIVLWRLAQRHQLLQPFHDQVD